MPNRTFAALIVLGVALVAAIGWSTHHLLVAGAPALLSEDIRPTLRCVLLPEGGDFLPHLASYAFLAAIGLGLCAGLRALWRQHRQTTNLLRTCRSREAALPSALQSVATRLQLEGLVDVVHSDLPLAFCYGLASPRILLDARLASSLTESELEAVLLHEREHLRQLDPLKVAIGRVLVSGLFFIPVLGMVYRQYLIEKELSADRAVIAAQGHSKHLASALLRLADLNVPSAPSTAGALSELDIRVAALLGEPWHPRWQLQPARVGASLLLLMAVIAPLIGAPLPVEGGVSSHNIVAGCHLPTALVGVPPSVVQTL